MGGERGRSAVPFEPPPHAVGRTSPGAHRRGDTSGTAFPHDVTPQPEKNNADRKNTTGTPTPGTSISKRQEAPKKRPTSHIKPATTAETWKNHAKIAQNKQGHIPLYQNKENACNPPKNEPQAYLPKNHYLISNLFPFPRTLPTLILLFI